jgi:hypothetical protein
VRGVSLEGFVALLLDVVSPVSVYQIHLASGPHFPSWVVFRCVTSQLRALEPPSDDTVTLPESHKRIFSVLKLWVEHRLSDFMDSPMLLNDMKGLMSDLQARNDLYGVVAAKLLDTAVESGEPRLRASGVADFSAADHHVLCVRLFARQANISPIWQSPSTLFS